MDCASPKPWPSQMFIFPMAVPGGHGGRQRGGSGAMCRWSAPWRINWEKLTDILVGPGKKGRKRKENTCTGYCRICGYSFSVAPFLSTVRRRSRWGCRFWRYRPFGVGAEPLSCLCLRCHVWSKIEKNNRKIQVVEYEGMVISLINLPCVQNEWGGQIW